MKSKKIGPIVAFLVISGVLGIAGSGESSGAEYTLQSKLAPGVVRQVTTELDVTGELRLNPDGKKVVKTGLKVRGRLQYEEQLLAAPPQGRLYTVPPEKGAELPPQALDAPPQILAARHYQSASAELTVGDSRLQPQLAPAHRYLATHVSASEIRFLAPTGEHLTREELDLVQVQANSVVLQELLPPDQQPVKLNGTWRVEDFALALLLGLDAVTDHQVRGKLTAVDGSRATIQYEGKLTGAIGGVATDIDLKANAYFELEQGQFSALAIALHETRSIGHAEPGFDVEAQLRVRLTPKLEAQHLDDAHLKQLGEIDSQQGGLLALRSTQAGFSLLHDANWRVMLDRRDLCVLRLVERGELVAQCNISRLPDLEAGKALPLEEFQADVQRSLGKSFGQFVKASQGKTAEGNRQLRLAAVGLVSELPIEWHYYHLSTAEGRQVSAVFTLESKLLDRLADRDGHLMDSLQIHALPEPGPQVTAVEGQPSDDRQGDQPVGSTAARSSASARNSASAGSSR